MLSRLSYPPREIKTYIRFDLKRQIENALSKLSHLKMFGEYIRMKDLRNRLLKSLDQDDV